MTTHVLVMGAGAIGCFVGGRLAAAGVEVDFVARPRVRQALAAHGLTLSAVDGGGVHLAATSLRLHEAPPPAAQPSLVLLCVKSGATVDAARQLHAALPAGTPVLSLQNGVANVEQAREAAPRLNWLAGMVPFNVAELGPGRYHRGTSGVLAAQAAPITQTLAPVFALGGLPLALHADMPAVQWGKLLLNLNNPVNALSGLPLKAQLLNRDLRCVVAALQQEALAALRAAGQAAARSTPVPAAWMPSVLRLPTPLFKLVAARSLKIDEHARSSMADDVALGRVPEVDALCGAVVRLAVAHGLPAPLNQRMVQLLLQRPVPRFTGRELQRELGLLNAA